MMVFFRWVFRVFAVIAIAFSGAQIILVLGLNFAEKKVQESLVKEGWENPRLMLDWGGLPAKIGFRLEGDTAGWRIFGDGVMDLGWREVAISVEQWELLPSDAPEAVPGSAEAHGEGVSVAEAEDRIAIIFQQLDDLPEVIKGFLPGWELAIGIHGGSLDAILSVFPGEFSGVLEYGKAKRTAGGDFKFSSGWRLTSGGHKLSILQDGMILSEDRTVAEDDPIGEAFHSDPFFERSTPPKGPANRWHSQVLWEPSDGWNIRNTLEAYQTGGYRLYADWAMGGTMVRLWEQRMAFPGRVRLTLTKPLEGGQGEVRLFKEVHESGLLHWEIHGLDFFIPDTLSSSSLSGKMSYRGDHWRIDESGERFTLSISPDTGNWSINAGFSLSALLNSSLGSWTGDESSANFTWHPDKVYPEGSIEIDMERYALEDFQVNGGSAKIEVKDGLDLFMKLRASDFSLGEEDFSNGMIQARWSPSASSIEKFEAEWKDGVVSLDPVSFFPRQAMPPFRIWFRDVSLREVVSNWSDLDVEASGDLSGYFHFLIHPTRLEWLGAEGWRNPDQQPGYFRLNKEKSLLAESSFARFLDPGTLQILQETLEDMEIDSMHWRILPGPQFPRKWFLSVRESPYKRNPKILDLNFYYDPSLQNLINQKVEELYPVLERMLP